MISRYHSTNRVSPVPYVLPQTMLSPNVLAAQTWQIRKTSYFRIQVVRGVYRTFISGEDGEADFERQARLSYVDFIPHYSTQESLLGQISFIFRIADIYARRTAARWLWLAGWHAGINVIAVFKQAIS